MHNAKNQDMIIKNCITAHTGSQTVQIRRLQVIPFIKKCIQPYYNLSKVVQLYVFVIPSKVLQGCDNIGKNVICNTVIRILQNRYQLNQVRE